MNTAKVSEAKRPALARTPAMEIRAIGRLLTGARPAEDKAEDKAEDEGAIDQWEVLQGPSFDGRCCGCKRLLVQGS
jgi:hypothetical protein